MDKLKQWVALAVLGVVVVLAAGWFLLVSPKRSEAADIALQTSEKQTSNQALQTKLALLKSQAKGLPAQQAKLSVVAAKIPDNPALPALIRALDAAAASADVELVSLAPSAPAAVTAAAPAAPVAAGAAAPASTGLQQIALNVNVVGGYFQVEQFLDRVENLTRAFKVNGFALAPGTDPLKVTTGAPTGPAQATGKTLTATINGQVFLVPATTVASPTVPVAPAAAVPAN